MELDPPKHRFARAVSIGCHPFIVLTGAVAWVTAPVLSPAHRTILLSGLLCVITIISVYVVVSLRRGTITNIDISKREQRPRFYLVAIAATAMSATLFGSLQLPRQVQVGSWVAAGMLTTSMVVNTKLKASLHVAHTVLALGYLWQALPFAGRIIGVVLVLLMCWSRVEMKRHTPAEVVAGAILGMLASLAFNLL
jgi:membrane-associated phospholipid phosphatase